MILGESTVHLDVDATKELKRFLKEFQKISIYKNLYIYLFFGYNINIFFIRGEQNASNNKIFWNSSEDDLMEMWNTKLFKKLEGLE